MLCINVVFQSQHYHYLMPEVFRQLQDLDEKRIKNIKNFMIQSVDVERKVFPIINQCLECIVNAANLINEKEVSKLYLLCNNGTVNSKNVTIWGFSTESTILGKRLYYYLIIL